MDSAGNSSGGAKRQSRSGIVLCAGRGRRLGQPKALLRLGEETLLDRAVRTLSQVCDEIVVPGALPLPPASRWRCVPDAAGAEGPIAGLIAGLEAAASPIAVVLACDLPLVPVALLRFLADRCAEGYLAVVPFAMEHFHSLCAAYSRALLPAMIEWVRSGRYSTCDLLRTLDDGVCVVDEGQLRQFGDPSIILLNVNSPADLERARELLPLLGS